MSKPLILSRRFAPLFVTQFLAAFNDNFLKNTLVFFILATMSVAQAGTLVTVAGAVFIAPFLLFSAIGGQIADRFDKAKVTRNLKLAEIGAAALAVVGIGTSSVTLMMVALFLFGTGSALFGPIKYGILPDHMDPEELPKANAWIEAATFIAILGGSIFAGVSFASGGGDVWVFGPVLIGISVACYVSSLFVPATVAADPGIRIDANVAKSTVSIIRDMYQDSRIFRTSLIISWFWLMGTVVLSILPTAVRALGGSEIASTVYLAVFAVSVAAGSAVAAWFSAGRVVLLPAVFGALFAGLACIDLGFALPGYPSETAVLPLSEFFASFGNLRIGLDLALIAFFGAFMAVPTFAAIQTWADPARRARTVAGNNVINALFMAAGAGLAAALQAMGAGIGMVAVIFGAASVAVSVVTFVKLPTSPFLDFISILFRAVYRLEVEGLENIEKAGPTPIFALNHVSFLDAALAMAFTDRRPIFAINTEIAKKWWVRPFLKVCNAFPLDPTKPIATRQLIRQVEAGNPLVIFPEGRITITAALMRIFSGAAMVADKTGAMIVPVKIEGLEKTHFSRLNDMQIRRRLFPKVKVKIMPPLRLDLGDELKGRRRRDAASAKLYEIMSDMVFQTSLKTGTVFTETVRAASEYGEGKIALTDYANETVNPLSYRMLLTGSRVLGGKFMKMFPDEKVVGVLLPNANGAAATILGLMSSGKTPAMINFTAGIASIRAACLASQSESIITSRAFIDKAKLHEVVETLSRDLRIVYLEDVRSTVTKLEKLAALLVRNKPLVESTADSPAVILFTSGSEGTPKGVVLTHRNILSNAAQAAARIDFNMSDTLFNILPVFHSFGLTAGLILPLTSGVPVHLYPSPLHYRIIPELIYSANATIMFATDTFLSGYARASHPFNLRSIRYIFAGAEPVKASTRETYMNKFLKPILEGYGVTEAAPVISINTALYNKPGTVGKLLPGMQARLETVPGVSEGGRLFVKGPNVMAGYLKVDQPGVLQPLEDGWHDTGDIVTIDDEDFIRIRGRAKRFAKIAGEMVSLAAVEEVAGDLWPGIASVVVALPDPRKGERLVLVTEQPGATKAAFATFAKTRGLAEIAFPSEIVIDKVPVLGTGKIDFVSAQRILEARDVAA
ncbi:acyl-[ACP]--phospholipid O-acyltransferase [Agrobacterium rubi]|nr:acyl-[ACP]--phospholipid O-acyltransferase [Agrobacterium rubi]NTF24016.1 acyl-[ACP]--phospholipid O-acyltransferase [Agrobacterium rubi]